MRQAIKKFTQGTFFLSMVSEAAVEAREVHGTFRIFSRRLIPLSITLPPFWLISAMLNSEGKMSLCLSILIADALSEETSDIEMNESLY